MPLEPEQTEAILEGLPEEAQADLLAATESRQYSAGEPIIKIGEPGDEIFFIVSGRVRVFAGTSDDAAERTLALLGPGQHFGEAAVITGGRRTASVTALTFVDCLVLNGSGYRQVTARHPQLLENLARSLRRVFEQDVEGRALRNRRRLHSVAVITDSPAGRATAAGLADLIRRRGDELCEMQCTSRAPDAEAGPGAALATVAAEDLRYEIASRFDGDNVVLVHADLDSAAAAIRECDRVVLAWESERELPRPLLDLLASHRPQRRTIIAWLHPANALRTAREVPEGGRGIAVCYRDGRGGALPAIDAPSLVRLDRALRGIRVGLALGGGGARGLAHIGILEVFERAGLAFDVIAGTSAGAIVAAAVAFGLSPAETRNFFASEMMPPAWMARTALGRRLFLMRTFRGRRIEGILRSIGGRVTFEQLRMPLFITTVDLVTGQQRVRCSGDVVQAILQSINHPAFGSPILEGGEALVDGGVLINVPASVLRSERCERVISIDVGSALSTEFGYDAQGNVLRPSYLSTLLRTMDVGRRHATDLHRDESDLLLVPDLGNYKLEDFHALDGLVDAGRAAGEKALAQVEKIFAEIEGPG